MRSLAIVFVAMLAGCGVFGDPYEPKKNAPSSAVKKDGAKARKDGAKPGKQGKKPGPAPRPEGLTRRALGEMLIAVAPPASRGIYRLALIYERPVDGGVRVENGDNFDEAGVAGMDRLVVYLDVQVARAEPMSVAVRDCLPVAGVGFETADRFDSGGPWTRAGGQRPPSGWAVDPLADIDALWSTLRLLRTAQRLARQAPGPQRRVKGGRIVVYQGMELLVATGGERPMLAGIRPTDAPPLVVRNTREGGLRLSRGGGALVVELGVADLGARPVGKVARTLSGPGKPSLRLSRAPRVDDEAQDDPFQLAMTAYRQALKARRDIGGALSLLRRRFGPWVGSALGAELGGEAWRRVDAGALDEALDLLASPETGPSRPAALDREARAAEALGAPLRGLALARAARRRGPTPERRWYEARLALAAMAAARTAKARGLLGARALALLMAVPGGRSRALAQVLARRADIEAPDGLTAKPVDAASAKPLLARYDRAVERAVARPRKPALTAEARARLVAALRQPRDVLARLLADGDQAPEQLAVHVDALLERADDPALLSTAIAAAHPRVSLDRGERAALVAQIERVVPELIAELVGKPGKQVAAELTRRLKLDALNPLVPWRKWPVAGLPLRLRQAFAERPPGARPADVARAIRREWARLELDSSPWLLARTPAERTRLRRLADRD